MKRYTPQPSRRRARGMSLVEVMVSIVVMSFGIIGLVGLQARAVQYSLSAEDTNRAALLANEIVSEMWMRKTANLDSAVIADWTARLSGAGGLPNGTGSVVVNGNQATVTVRWQPPQATSPSNYVTDVVIQ